MNISNSQSQSKLKISDLTMVAMAAALLAISAQIAIPLGPVPFTLQTAFFLMVAIILPPKNAFLAISAYLLLGAIGLPVFSAGRGGLGQLFGPTGGFLFGFWPAVLACSFILKKAEYLSLKRVYLAAISATIIIFICGIAYYAILSNISFYQSFLVVALPFLAIDAAKIMIFTPIAWQVRQRLSIFNEAKWGK